VRVSQVAQQRALADPWLAKQDQDGALPGAGLLHQVGKVRAFALTAV
jgi:hypothetical protein